MLSLQIPITPSSVDTIKAYLLKSIPHVKSSHRVEAAARALGFGTYAAMLAAAKSDEIRFGVLHEQLFRSYLRERDQDVTSIHIYRAAARVAVSAVMNTVPRLSMRGYGVGQPQRIYGEKRWETPTESYVRFTKDRTEFLSDNALDEFLRALAFIGRIPPTKTIRGGTGSYRLKHLAENMPITLPDGMTLGPDYVSNGALIAAAIHAGFKMKTHVDDLGYEEINVTFNMPKKVVDDLDCELRPDGGFAQDRARLVEFRKRSRRYGYSM